MYSSFPRRDRIAIRASLTTSWAFSALAGVGGVWLTPVTVVSEVGAVYPTVTSAIVLVASVLAIWGVLRNRHEYEWVAAYFAAAGLFAYVATVWYLFFFSSNTRLQQASFLTSLLGFYAYRIIACSAHARKQRAIHELVANNTGETPIADGS